MFIKILLLYASNPQFLLNGHWSIIPQFLLKLPLTAVACDRLLLFTILNLSRKVCLISIMRSSLRPMSFDLYGVYPVHTKTTVMQSMINEFDFNWYTVHCKITHIFCNLRRLLFCFVIHVYHIW